MQKRRLGDSDLTSSAIAFGCWEIGGTFGQIDDSAVVKAIHRAIDLGVTTFDTAHVYGFDGGLQNWDGVGRSEQVLGKALASRRSDVNIVTKGAVPTRQGQVWPRDGRYEEIIKDAEASLTALNTDYIDLYLIHWPDPKVTIEEMMRALNDLRQAGKVRHVGVSNFPAAKLREARSYAPIIANQVGYNLFDRRWEREMFSTANELGIGVMTYGPLAHGLLTGAFSLDTTFDETDWRRKGLLFGQALYAPGHFEKNLEVIEQLKGIAARKGVSLPRLALAWVLSNPTVSVGVVGARNVHEIEDNVEAVEITLDRDDLAEIDKIMTGASGQVDFLPE